MTNSVKTNRERVGERLKNKLRKFSSSREEERNGGGVARKGSDRFEDDWVRDDNLLRKNRQRL